MRASKIEARRVFTRYGWQPINADAFLDSAGTQVVEILDNANYKMRIYESRAQGTGAKWYAQVTDRKCNERYYLSAIAHKVRYEEMKNDLKLNLIVKL